MTTDHPLLLSMVSAHPTGTEQMADTRRDENTIDCPEEPLFKTFIEDGGYYPSAKVGHRMSVDGRYELVRKLGWARSSTVWLTTDTKAADHDGRVYVAVKILTTSATQLVETHPSQEDKVFAKIASADSSHPGFQHCLALRDHFLATSIFGDHTCFVIDPLGSSLQKLRPPDRKTFTVPVAKRIIKQLLLALQFLHDECGYIHTDVKSDNVLVKFPPMSDPQIDEYLQLNPTVTYGEPAEVDSFPEPIIFTKSQPLPNFGLNTALDNISVCLIDYSEATPVNKPTHGDHYQPPIVRAPEVILGFPWSSSIDIWTIGCLLFEIITDYHLFAGNTSTYSVDFHLQNMVEYLGPFPPNFLSACTRRSDFFDEDGNLLRIENYNPAGLEEILSELQVESEDVQDTAAFIRRCLTLDPALRPTAEGLLHDAWLAPSTSI